MSGRSEVTPSPLQPRALSHHMMHLPLNPNPPRSAPNVPTYGQPFEGQSALTALHNIFSTPPGGHLMPWNEGSMGPRTQPHTPTPDNGSRFTDDRPRFHLNPLAWEASAFEEDAPIAEPEAQHATHPEAEAALAEDEEDAPLEGAELTAAEAEVEGRFEVDLGVARTALQGLQNALSDSWNGLEESSRDRSDKAKHLAKVKKHLSRLYDLQPLALDSRDAERCLGQVRGGLEALQAIAQGAVDDAGTEVDQLKRHVRVLRSMLNPLAREPGGRTTPLCGVCMARPVSRAILPCGHTLCESCATRQGHVGNGACFNCRGRVEGSRRIYF